MVNKKLSIVPHLLVVGGSEEEEGAVTAEFSESARYGEWLVLDGVDSQASFVDSSDNVLTVASARRIFEIAQGKNVSDNSTITSAAAEIALGYLPEDIQKALDPNPLGA